MRGRARLVLVALAGLLLIAVALGAANRDRLARAAHRRADGMASTGMGRVAAAALAWAAPAGAQTQAPLPPPPPTVLGMNPAGLVYYEQSVPFTNLMIGSEWLDAHWAHLADRHRGRDGSILSLPAGEGAQVFVPVPPTGPKGIEIRCSWSGSGTVGLQGGGDSIVSSATSLRFHVVNRRGDPRPPFLALSAVDPRRPFRDLDCHQIRPGPAGRFRPEFLQTVRGYGVLRFMDWQNANANLPASWATRRHPGDTAADGDGVSIEDMMALANEVGADPWFVMPWNADDAYVAGFARLVAATLPPGRHVYVETANEVWNGSFPVAAQAIREGLARKLGADPFTAGTRRYAQRTVEVMRLWEAAFAGRGGLVRVLSTQHVRPEAAEIALAFADTARHVDALATAPYFGDVYGGSQNTRETVLAKLSAALDATVAAAVANRRVAAGRGKRYLAYEGGSALILPAQKALLIQLQHDPAQLDLYRRFLAAWRRQVGDVLCLYNSVSEGWGLAQWEDETEAQAPKLRAVREAAPAR